MLLAQRLGLRRVFLLDDGSPYGYPMALYFRRAARELGLELAGSASWSEGAPRAGRLAQRVRRASPDGVFLAGLLGTGGGTVVHALRRELGTEVPLIAPDAFGPVFALFDFSGGTARGMYLSVPGLPTERLPPAGKRVVRELSATQPGAPVSDVAVYAAQAAELLLAAIAESRWNARRRVAPTPRVERGRRHHRESGVHAAGRCPAPSGDHLPRARADGRQQDRGLRGGGSRPGHPGPARCCAVRRPPA